MQAGVNDLSKEAVGFRELLDISVKELRIALSLGLAGFQ